MTTFLDRLAILVVILGLLAILAEFAARALDWAAADHERLALLILAPVAVYGVGLIYAAWVSTGPDGR
jgi:hypothetical protein